MLSNHTPFSRTRTAPTGYEKVRLLFHGIRSVQCISSIITASILIFFVWWLVHDHIGTPWTFIILLATTFLTVICLTATICFHCLTGLSPRVNLVLNSVMLFFWALGFSMLSYWMWGTLVHQCTVNLWQDEDGVMVCRTYKALFTFALTGFLSTAAALALDVHIHRLTVRFGKHMRLENLDTKGPRTVVDARGPYADQDNARSVDDLEGYPSRNSDAFEVPQVGYGAGAQAQQQNKLLGDEGYTVPDGQFDYDTRYHGGHEDRVFGGK